MSNISAPTTTASVTSATTILTIDTLGFAAVAFQFTSVGTGNTVTFNGSNDGTNYVAVPAERTDTVSAIAATSIASPATTMGFLARAQFRYFRLVCSVYGSDTLTAVATKLVGDPGDPLVGLRGGTASIGTVNGYGFDAVVAPTVTNGAYTAGDIMGGLLTFTVARVADEAFIVQSVQVTTKSEQATTNFMLVLFSADPTGTTQTDNAAYSLAVADAFKVEVSLPLNSLGAINTDHGTPHTITVGNLARVMKPVSGAQTILGLLIDNQGLTLTSTSDIQVRLTGTGV